MKKSRKDVEFEAVQSVIRFLRWFVPPDCRCMICGDWTDGEEFFTLYRPWPDEPVLGIYGAHEECRMLANRKLARVAVDCGCVVEATSQVRITPCGEHEIGTVHSALLPRTG